MDLSLTDVWCAWRAFRRGKKPSRAILLFESDLELNLLRLCAELNDGRYQHGDYDHKIVHEKKRRDIAVARVRDRVVHRMLYDYLLFRVDKRLDYDVWSCRQGKGLHAALDRTAQMVDKHAGGWVWRADITKFFDNVDHAILRSCLKRVVPDEEAMNILDTVISSYITIGKFQRGIPIGNLTSQIFANIYLNEFDRFVRVACRPEAYVRYGDDFLLFASTRTEAMCMRRLATEWLYAKLALTVNTKNDVLFRTRHGAKFLGHWIYPGRQVALKYATQCQILHTATCQNASSYLSLRLTNKNRNLFRWRLVQDISCIWYNGVDGTGIKTDCC